MKKSVKILISGSFDHKKYGNFILQEASSLEIQGTLQGFEDNSFLIYAIGDTENVETLIDKLYEGVSDSVINNVEVKPIDEHRDFRGVFRIIDNK